MTDDRITPGERRELRAVVRQRIKVLRAEVKLRRGELLAEAEARLLEKYQEEDRAADELGHEIAKVTADANRALITVLKQYEEHLDGRWQQFTTGFRTPTVARATTGRAQLRTAMIAGIDAQVQAAQLDLERQEAELLTQLALEALETTAARSFLARIPTVAELVPSKRLQEIEAAFDQREAL